MRYTPEEVKKEIGRRIRELRIAKGMSQEELAKAVGYKSTNSRSTINKVEKGQNDISQSRIRIYASVLGVSPTYLMGMDDAFEQFDESLETETIQVEVKVYDAVQQAFGKDGFTILQLFNSLNDVGKAKAIENLEDLLSIPKYKKEGLDDEEG